MEHQLISPILSFMHTKFLNERYINIKHQQNSGVLPMRTLKYVILLGMLITSCSIKSTSSPGTFPSETTVHLPTTTATIAPSIAASSTTTPTSSPTSTIIRLPTSTRTPYPLPDEILSRDELQERINQWINGEIILTNAEMPLDEVTGEPIRLGVLGKPVINYVLFFFYNLGFTIIEDEQGIPYILNIVGFEDADGNRFTFPFHNGKLFSTRESIILQEFNGMRLNQGVIKYYEKLTPMDFIQKSNDLVGYVNGGTTIIGADGRGNEGSTFMETSKETTYQLNRFLECSNCTLPDIPNSIKKYINTIPESYDPSIPYIWVYSVAY